ncbi:MqnA/MqnD/SBP family protein [Frigoriglobus tundricola]|uniref:1,4-dihydroxy-6-naphtoate synthase n=1 Tax=Frigoriglobus tundricola TaxID=2774151 RepID=A0A6M5Z606_9BACT|nr:MqnA/MqnD/SBP family protein [Frigoriglobus tundricola]QJX01287.1 Menaquinone via futalosine step 4 [Frigoriglobus tundricola]
MRRTTPITIAYTPDSDDAFYYDALEHGLVSMPGYRPRFRREPMAVLNREALTGTNEVTAISSVVYPAIAGRYAILSVGTSVGRGYGPVLVSREPRTLSALAGRRVGVPGVPTTGWFLLRTLCPGAVTVEMPFDEIAGAVAAGALDAGVMIHEELLYYPRMGLRRVTDLGAEWCRRHALPLPVGLNVVRRDLGSAGMRTVCTAISASLHHARLNPEPALARVSRFGRGATGGCTEQFVQMFANDDSQCMPADVRAALGVLLAQVVALGAGPAVPPIDIIEPAPATVAVA